MTAFNRVRAYYAAYNEWDRLSTPEGRIEYDLTCELLETRINPGSRVLDLGGGPGRYTVYLAGKGHQVTLADLSPALLDIARGKIDAHGVGENVEDVREVNATDLSDYPDDHFDAALCFGPYYHLTDKTEREQATAELSRVIKPDGVVFAAFAPRICGLTGLITRAAGHPDQVTAEVFRETADTGIFRNAASSGFQEGYYPEPAEMASLFETHGFTTVMLHSQKGIAYGLADLLNTIEDQDESLYEEIKNEIRSTAQNPEVIAHAGQALYVGRRNR